MKRRRCCYKINENTLRLGQGKYKGARVITQYWRPNNLISPYYYYLLSDGEDAT